MVNLCNSMTMGRILFFILISSGFSITAQNGNYLVSDIDTITSKYFSLIKLVDNETKDTLNAISHKGYLDYGCDSLLTVGQSYSLSLRKDEPSNYIRVVRDYKLFYFGDRLFMNTSKDIYVINNLNCLCFNW